MNLVYVPGKKIKGPRKTGGRGRRNMNSMLKNLNLNEVQ